MVERRAVILNEIMCVLVHGHFGLRSYWRFGATKLTVVKSESSWWNNAATPLTSLERFEPGARPVSVLSAAPLGGC